LPGAATTSDRACYYHSANGQTDFVLTGPTQAPLSGRDLMRLALKATQEADVVGEDWPRIPLEELQAGLRIGTRPPPYTQRPARKAGLFYWKDSMQPLVIDNDCDPFYNRNCRVKRSHRHPAQIPINLVGDMHQLYAGLIMMQILHYFDSNCKPRLLVHSLVRVL
jgi:hypothetical protein